jgi:predicted cupin superfamily sugar epimerase
MKQPSSPTSADAVDLRCFDGRPVHPDTAALIRHYRFERLPVEGTLFASTWRSDRVSAEGGPAGTAMIGLYAESPLSQSCFHRLEYDEVWHAYGGDPFRLHLLFPDGRAESVLMGGDPLSGRPVQFVVPAGVWQAGCLEPGGRYALFGCTMSPGFTGGCFEAGVTDELTRQYPGQAELIRRLSVNGEHRRMPAGFAS